MNRPNRIRRRELESELRDVPTPPPPTDLLDRIVQEIPQDLGAANSAAPKPRRPWHATTGFRLAATLAIATVGVTLAYRTMTDRAREEASRAGEREALAAPAQSFDQSRPETPKVVSETDAIARQTKDERPSSKGRTSAEQAPLATATAPAPPSLEVSDADGKKVAESAEVGAAAAPAPAPPPAGVPAEAESARELRSLGYLSDRAAKAAPEPSPVARSGAAAGAPSSLEASGVRRRDELARGNEETEGRSRQIQEARRKMAGLEQEMRRPQAAAPSTGGEREPLEQPVGDMFFRATGTNPFVDTAEDALSTFALDVDTGSYTLARSYLERGALPPAEAIRVEEFVNAQTYEDPAPRRGEFTLTAEGAPSPFAPGERYRLLRFAVRARDVAEWQRKPAVLTFVVDVSGSMDRENRLELVKRALGLLLDELGADDRVGLVVYGSQGRVLLGHTRDHEAIRAAIRRLVPEGSTNAEEGLRLGYDLASEAWRDGWINRVILCSDGVANVGATGPESILARIGREARRGIELTTVGFGMGNYNDALMEQLADQGDGAYHYVDTLDEARRVFVENLTGTLQTVAKDAKVQVEFDPGTVDRWRLVGYENRDVADRDFRNDRVDAGEVGVGAAVTALYEIRLAGVARGGDRVATLRLRWKSVDGGRVMEAHQDLGLGDLGRSFERASRDLRVAAVAAELAERLESSYYARDNDWGDLVAEARELRRDFGRDRPVADLADLVDRAARLAAGREPDPDDRHRGPLDDQE